MNPAARIARRCLAAALGTCLALTAVAAPVQAKTPPPPRALASNTIDAHLGYQPQDSCSPSAKPGAKALLKLLIQTWGGSSSGISRSCNAAGRSEHKEGRALDWHMSVKKASQRKRVNAALRWITANHGEVALRLGIMYVIWNQRIWSVYYPELGWRKMASRGSATANHKDHVHISLSWDGAYKQTSWWTGVPVTSPLNSRCGVGHARACLPTIARTTKSWPYQRTAVPASFTPAPWVIPGVGGSPRVGIVQRAVPGTWVPAGATLSYQWTSDGRPIAGATESTYLLPPGQVGHEVEVTVTATSGGKVLRRSSDNIADVYRGVFAAATPSVVGTAAPGNTLQVNLRAWSPTPSRFRYAWLRDGKKISGATAATYAVRSKDRGHRISVQVTGSRAGYVTRTATSKRVKVEAPFSTAPVPKITGTTTIGSTLLVDAGSWIPAATLSYQWFADGAAISNATARQLALIADYRDRMITVEVTARRSGNATTTVRSAPVGPVTGS